MDNKKYMEYLKEWGERHKRKRGDKYLYNRFTIPVADMQETDMAALAAAYACVVRDPSGTSPLMEPINRMESEYTVESEDTNE